MKVKITNETKQVFPNTPEPFVKVVEVGSLELVPPVRVLMETTGLKRVVYEWDEVVAIYEVVEEEEQENI